MNKVSDHKIIAALRTAPDPAAFLRRYPVSADEAGTAELTAEQAAHLAFLTVEAAAADDADVRLVYEKLQAEEAEPRRGLEEIDWGVVMDTIPEIIGWLEIGKAPVRVYLKTRKQQGKLDKWLADPYWCNFYKEFTGDDSCKSESE